MAKAALKKAAKRMTKPVKPALRPAAAKRTKTIKSAAPAKKPVTAKAPVVSKDELRAQLEKAQNLIAALRTKGREAVREAKVSAAKIAELEAKVALLEKKSAAQEKSTNPVSAAAKPAKRRGRKVPVQADDDGPIKSPDQELTEAETPAD
jgi:septal ring factor EnvC (AmiA/AmiB activator)